MESVIIDVIISIASFIYGVWCGKQMMPEDNKIKTKEQKVLVIRPVKHTTAEEQKQIEQIQPKNGKVILPQWCEYQFGEISNVIIGNQGEH
jgi:hypothetical protein